MTDFQFHLISLVLESGLLAAFLGGVWKASAVVQDFQVVKQRQEEHIEDDKEQFSGINASLISMAKGVARIEGRLNGK